jgi:aminocarboxymuconate-semialdehyde decarboxylase
MLIDVHNHALPEQAIELLRSDSTFGVELDGYSWTGGHDAVMSGTKIQFEVGPAFRETKAKLAELDTNGIDGAIMSVTPPLFYYELDAEPMGQLCAATNAGLAEMAAEAPDRLWWMAHLPMQAPEAAIEMLEREKANGCVGVEIGSSIGGARLDEPQFEPFWSGVARLGMPVMIHPDVSFDSISALMPFYFGNVIGLPLETTVTIERIIAAGVLDRNPDARIVLVHAGGYFPYQAGRVRHAGTVRPELADSPADPFDYIGKVLFDPITHDRQALEYLVSRVGVENVVLGTDLPFDMALINAPAAVRDAVGDDQAKTINESNPARVYGLDV